jgi:hypothetical protein
MPRPVYGICVLFAVICSYVLSQLGFLATLVTIGLSLCGLLVWRKTRPQDFIVKDYLTRVFTALTWVLVFSVSYFIVRMFQPTNYRIHNLASMVIFSALLALYFGAIGWTRRSR